MRSGALQGDGQEATRCPQSTAHPAPRQTRQRAGIRIIDDAFYWRFLEFGTSKMAARPFFRPAIDTVSPQLVHIVGEQLQAGIDRAAKKLGAK
jgi:HK97 gp10 family phage protein